MNSVCKIQSTSQKAASAAPTGTALTTGLSIVIILFLAACANQAPSEAWLHTSRSGLWSREEVAKTLLENAKIEGKSRAEVMQIFGTPDISEKKVTQEKDEATRNDTYQLSFLNTTSLDIEYDANDVVKRYTFGPGCLANYFPGSEFKSADTTNSANVSGKQTDYSTRNRITSHQLKLKEGELEHLWGPPDMSEVDIVPNFPTPLRSSYYSWRLTPDGHEYILAETDGAFNIAPARRQILTLVTVTLGPECPVRRPVEEGIK